MVAGAARASQLGDLWLHAGRLRQVRQPSEGGGGLQGNAHLGQAGSRYDSDVQAECLPTFALVG